MLTFLQSAISKRMKMNTVYTHCHRGQMAPLTSDAEINIPLDKDTCA